MDFSPNFLISESECCKAIKEWILERESTFRDIKEVEIPVVMRIGVAEEIGRTYFEPFEPHYGMAIFKGCKPPLLIPISWLRSHTKDN